MGCFPIHLFHRAEKELYPLVAAIGLGGLFQACCFILSDE